MNLAHRKSFRNTVILTGSAVKWLKIANLLKNPKAYRIKHQAEYQLHDSLKKELLDLGVTKIPSSNKIQKRVENLESEQTATVREKQELQKKLKTLEIIQQNFTALLDAPKIRLTSSKAGICFCLKR